MTAEGSDAAIHRSCYGFGKTAMQEVRYAFSSSGDTRSMEDVAVGFDEGRKADGRWKKEQNARKGLYTAKILLSPCKLTRADSSSGFQNDSCSM